MFFGRPAHAVDIFRHSIVIGQIGDLLIGVPETPMGGDWRDFANLHLCCRSIDMDFIVERDAIRKARYYKGVEENGSGDSD